MNLTADKPGTQIPLVYDKELKFYLQFFIGMELLKKTRSYEVHFETFKKKFEDFYLDSKIPPYTKYQIINAISAIDKYQIVKHLDLYKFRKIEFIY